MHGHDNLESHLRDDINTDDPGVELSETGTPVTGGAMADVVVDQTRSLTPEYEQDEGPVEDEAHRGE